MGTNRDFGNMLNQQYVKTEAPPKKKTSVYAKMLKGKKNGSKDSR